VLNAARFRPGFAAAFPLPKRRELRSEQKPAPPIVFSSRVGTLTAQVVGTFDTAGAFQASSTSIIGTRLLRGISGQLTRGQREPDHGGFAETITGTLCLG
jgi:hypothetical protein